MAQVDCFGKSDIEVIEIGIDGCDGPPMKKFKQVRLPFKPLDPTSQKQVIGTSPGGKKRKLSDNESPSAKQMRISASKQVQKPISAECDPEVSSSSETDVNTLGHKKGVRKVNTLDSFFKPKTVKRDEQEEISSTNDYIDLTDNKTDDDIAEGKLEETESMEISGEVESKICDEKKDENKDVNTDESSKETENSEDESGTDSVDKEEEDKENEDKRKLGLDQSFISDISVCEDAIKTPAKSKDEDAKSESTEKDTVASVESTVDPSTSDATPAEVMKQNKTPGSAPRKLSERKIKEKEEQRLKREKELEEKRLQKQKEKEDKERIRLEKKKQKDQEKLEKEKARLEEKEKKEQERLEKIKQKEEEKKQKDKEIEAKNEEKKKKDEEKKQKDEEKKQKDEEKKQKEEEKKKEEEEKLKKEAKKKESFKNFFFKKAPTVSPPKSSENTMKSFFMPFEVKTNMRLAPEYRACLDDEQKTKLDDLLCDQTVEENYIKSMRDSAFIKRKSTKTWPRELNEEKDVEIISHDKDVIEKVTHHAKFLGFHENTRPAYYGTWRKKSSKLTPRNPFKQDEGLFDYEVDSDDEWVEEEPGESVSSDEEEDEDKEKEDDDEEEEAGWMVPHGYLSDGEGAEDGEEVDNASKQDLQKIRQAAWESELKRQAKPLRMIAIGCYWSGDSTSKIAALQLEMLLKYKAVSLRGEMVPTSLNTVKTEVSSSKKKGKNDDKAIKSSLRKSVPEEAIPDLIRLLHGNPSGMKNLIKEFRMFWKLKTDPSASSSANDTADTSQLETSAMDVDDNQEKVEQETPKTSDGKAESQDDFSISKRQLWMKIPVIAVREKRPEHKKICWYVQTDILKQYKMEDITLPNTWKYVCVKEPKWALEKEKEKPEENANTSTGKAGQTASTPSGRSTPNIMQYAQPMSLSKIQAIGMPAVFKASTPETKEKVKIELMDSTPVTPVQHSLPPDQKTIKDMFSGKKVKRELLSPASSKLPQQKKELHTKGSPKNALTTFLKTKTRQELAVIEIKDDEMEISKNISETDKKLTVVVNKPITPKTSGYQVLDSILSSPDLMKESPDNKKAGNKEQKGLSKDAGTDHSMEVDDVIVID